MEDRYPNQLLRDPSREPGDKLFREILSKQLCRTYEELLKTVSEMGLSHEWRLLQMTVKAWLCKITHKKENGCMAFFMEELFQDRFLLY
jgi:hypothetical protein